MIWTATVETRLHGDLTDSETFTVGDQSVIRTPDGLTIVSHNDVWSSYVIVLPEYREIRACMIVATYPKRRYLDAEDVYSDEEITSVLHGTDCSRSLWARAHQGEFLDPDFPACQRLSAGGSLRNISPPDLARYLY